MHVSIPSPVRVLGGLLGLALALAATVAQANDILICKQSVRETTPAGSSFNFTLDDRPDFKLTLAAPDSKTCMQFQNVGVGDHIITEAAIIATDLRAITVDPEDRLVSLNLALRTVTVEAVNDPTPTTVTFENCGPCIPEGGGNLESAHFCQDNFQACGFKNVGQCLSAAAHNGFVVPGGCCNTGCH